MDQKVELKTFTREEVLLAAETLNTTLAGKRRIMMTPDQFSAVEEISPLPNSPGLPPGEIVPGVGGYLYNIPVFMDQNSTSSYMV
jgi:hypothetical protein